MLDSRLCILASSLALSVAWADRPSAESGDRPVDGISRAAVYTVNESIETERDLHLAQRVPSDVLIRGWFKWRTAPDFSALAPLATRAHAAGSLFGGGVTVSALYHGENALSESQVLDMATRDPAGRLVDAWKNAGVRHGTLSNPKYLEYVLSWATKQIDAGADHLFMDEINAALHANEGYDDYANNDFRSWLIGEFTVGWRWTEDDPRWKSELGIDLRNKTIAPDGTMRSFDYREFLRAGDFLDEPLSDGNPLATHWRRFRVQRDDTAWKWLCDRIRAHAVKAGRNISVSGNGLAKHVDIQTLGVWGLWRVKDGRVDFSESQTHAWASTVRTGATLAGRKVPTVFFHDWGFEGFPYLQVTPAERTLWNRIRGAEIYAAGAFYAFPVHGPFGCDAAHDGTIDAIARQARFYQDHRSLYLDADFRGIDCVEPTQPLLSASLWTRTNTPAVIVHVVNRKVEGTRIATRSDVTISAPTSVAPRSVKVISPDWDASKSATIQQEDGYIRLLLPEFEAYVVAILEYDALPSLLIPADRILLEKRWERPGRSDFVVSPDGWIQDSQALNGVLQGRLHPHLSNPPVFTVHAKDASQLMFHVQSVSTAGAILRCFIDDQLVRTVDLPDLDAQNDTHAHEYDRTITVPIPPGRHRVRLVNAGGDWASLAWIRFVGRFGEVR